MKISGPGQIQSSGIKKTASKGRSSGASFSAEISDTEASSQTASVSGSGPIASLDSLLALQGVPDSTNGRSKGLARAEEMLDLLDEVRKGILLGAISMPNLRSLADMARNHKNSTDDSRLNEILAEIELRAEVELAKFGV